MRVPALLVLLAVAASSCGLAAEREEPDALRPGIQEAPAGEPIPEILAAVEDDDEDGGEAAAAAPDTSAPAEDLGDTYDGPDSTYIFDQAHLHTFELELSDVNLATLDADPQAEEYVDGLLSFEGAPVGAVGVRYKGSVGAFIECVAETGDGTGLLAGAKTCTKLSMKIKINWDGSDARFYDLRKLQLHSQNGDPSQMHERLAYWVFGEMGVPAPRSVHARLVINGEYVGLFALTEQVDGRFASWNFDDGSGNVFKERWPLDSDGFAVHEAVLASGLRTNEDVASVGLMRSFGEELEAAVNDTELRAVIEKYLDVDETMSFIAVDRAIRNDDGPLHWFCFDECVNHNLYWYSDPTTQKLHLIPWDLDNTFQNIVSDRNPYSTLPHAWNEISNDCQVFTHGELGFPQRSAACDRLIAGLTLFESEYAEAQQRLLAGPFAPGVIEAKLAEWSAQIEAATAEAAAMHADALAVAAWRSAVEELRAAIVFARVELEGTLATG